MEQLAKGTSKQGRLETLSLKYLHRAIGERRQKNFNPHRTVKRFCTQF